MSRRLPDHPDIEHLKKEAKSLLRGALAGDPEALARVRPALKSPGAEPKLSDAQHAIAVEFGFQNWSSLKNAVDLARADDKPHEALAAAVTRADVAAVRRILSRARPVTWIDEAFPGADFGATVLIRAARVGNTDIIDLLIDAGANPNQGSHWWAGAFTPLDSAANDEVAHHLIRRGAVLTLYAAAQRGWRDDVVRLLTEDPSSVASRGGDGQTPLHVAKTVDIAELLLDAGADIDALDVDHESTPAMYQIGERPSITRFLMERGARTDFLMAVAAGDRALVRQYLDRDPDLVRMTVSDRYFPMKNHRAGGTIYTWTLGLGKSAHRIAREKGHAEIYDLLMERSPASLQLAAAAESGDVDRVRAMTAANRNLAKTLRPDEQTKIVGAADSNVADRVRLMLEAGWPATAERGDGSTALHYAGFHGNADMVAALLAAGARTDVRERTYNAFPLGWAFHGSLNSWHRQQGDYARAVALMLDAGAPRPATNEPIAASDDVLAVLRARGIISNTDPSSP